MPVRCTWTPRTTASAGVATPDSPALSTSSGTITAASRSLFIPLAAGAIALGAAVPVKDLLEVSAAFIRPAFGGQVLPESPEEALPAGRFHRVPLILGTTRDEARFFVGLAGNPVTADSYPRLLTEAFGAAADEIAARYPLDRFPTPSLAWAQLSTDRAWARPGWDLARVCAAHTDTWCYEFADQDAPPLLPGFPAGAVHSSELVYQFDFPGGPALPAAQRELAERMNQYWTAFATNGTPARDGLPAWPDVSTGHVQSLAPDRIGGTDYVTDHQLDFWARMP
jgi:para-nitrobenzyl esterase